MDRIAWIYAFGWYLLTQIAARLLAAPDLNVNVANHIQTAGKQLSPAIGNSGW
jgi:hypothetical protein